MSGESGTGLRGNIDLYGSVNSCFSKFKSDALFANGDHSRDRGNVGNGDDAVDRKSVV